MVISAFPNLTVPFANPMELGIHFQKHGHKFGAQSAADYERIADAFMFGPMNADTRECTRPGNIDRLRHDFVTTYFGCVCTGANPHFLRTFYPVDPRTLARHGGSARFFGFECARTNL